MKEFGERERLALFLNYASMHLTKVHAALLAHFPEPAEAFEAARHRDEAAFDFTTNFVQNRLFLAAEDGFLDRYINWMTKRGVGVCIPEHSNYPTLLKAIHDPPSVLFYLGHIPEEIPLPIAIVGARRSTKYGKDIARLFGNELALRGACIVSGLAAGIDAMAARGALDAADHSFPTIAVLGTGIDVAYPKANAPLYDEIAKRGAIVTEFLPGEQPLAEHFPIRNRIISGISLGTVVVEAGERSGASITASSALEQGRDVFAIPGRITDLMSVGTNRLIQQGAAKPVFCAADILCEYGAAGTEERAASPAYASDGAALSSDEKRIADALKAGDLDADELSQNLRMPAANLNCALTALEFSGIIKPLPGRRFSLILKHL